MAPSDDTAHSVWRVGITGGIASGKTTVANAFAALGVPVIDTDEIARDVVVPGSRGLADVVAAFGPEVLDTDGRLNRRRLRERIFASPAERRRLEAILHPLIWQEVARRSAAIQGAPYCVVVIPLLAEGGRREELDRVLVVDCPPALQRSRLMARDGEDEAGARRILASQATREDRLAIADEVIENTGDRADLEREVARLHARYTRLAAQR